MVSRPVRLHCRYYRIGCEPPTSVAGDVFCCMQALVARDHSTTHTQPA